MKLACFSLLNLMWHREVGVSEVGGKGEEIIGLRRLSFFLLLSPLVVGERLRNKVDEYLYFLHPLISRDFRGQEAWGEQGVFPSINI